MSAELRAQQIKLRRLEIYATLAEFKRAYVCDGKEAPFTERVTLEAEDAALALEARQIGLQVELAKIERRKAINAQMLQTLVRMLEERGMQALVAEAEAASKAALEGVAS